MPYILIMYLLYISIHWNIKCLRSEIFACFSVYCCLPSTQPLANIVCSICRHFSKFGTQKSSIRMTWKLFRNMLERPMLGPCCTPSEFETQRTVSNNLCFDESSLQVILNSCKFWESLWWILIKWEKQWENFYSCYLLTATAITALD